MASDEIRPCLQAAPWAGPFLGLLGVLAFSGTLPATRLAVPVFGPTFLTSSRILLAALLSAICVLAFRYALPKRRHFKSIVWMAMGLAVAYPFFVALAMGRVPAAHGVVVTGLAPAATAVLAVIRVGERPPLRFWLACAGGAITVVFFALWAGGGRAELADLWLLAAIISVGLAYVEGGRVSRELGGTATICWAMLLLAPFALGAALLSAANIEWKAAPGEAWYGLFYAGFVSMFLGSVAWYKGLAIGGIARIGQLNLLQPFLGLIWCWLLLGEAVSVPFFAAAGIVVLCMAICMQSRSPVKQASADGR